MGGFARKIGGFLKLTAKDALKPKNQLKDMLMSGLPPHLSPRAIKEGFFDVKSKEKEQKDEQAAQQAAQTASTTAEQNTMSAYAAELARLRRKRGFASTLLSKEGMLG